MIDLYLQEGDDGAALAEGLAARGVPVIIATAYGEDLPSGFLRRVQRMAVLQKPFAPEALMAAVQTAVAMSATRIGFGRRRHGAAIKLSIVRPIPGCVKSPAGRPGGAT